MKIALIYLSDYENWPMGGMLNYIRNIVPGLSDHDRWELDLWGGTKAGECRSTFKINDRSYDFERYTSFYTENKIIPNFVMSFLCALIRARKFKRYDVIYSHTAATTIALKLAHPKQCVIHHQHGLSYKRNKGFTRILNIGYTIAQFMADATLFVASENEVDVHKKGKPFFKRKTFYAVGSPINYKMIFSASSNRKVHDDIRFIYTGRIDAWKNVELLIHSFNLFLEEGNKGHLTIVGDGPQFNYIKEKISDMGLDQSIEMVGRRRGEEIIKYLSESDIFLFPSKGEGVSLSLLEAFAAGLPAVSFNVIGVNDLVENGKTGVVVEAMDAEAYKEGIISLSKTYKGMIDDCRMVAEKYDSEKVVNIIINIILNEMSKVTKR